jgi:hypothetical protein
VYTQQPARLGDWTEWFTNPFAAAYKAGTAIGTRSGDATPVTDAADAQMVQQLHSLALQINTAKQANNVPEVQRLLSQFRVLADHYREVGPIGVSPFDTFLLATQDWVQQSLNALPNAVAAVPLAIGQGLLKAAIPFAVLAAGALYFKHKL